MDDFGRYPDLGDRGIGSKLAVQQRVGLLSERRTRLDPDHRAGAYAARPHLIAIGQRDDLLGGDEKKAAQGSRFTRIAGPSIKTTAHTMRPCAVPLFFELFSCLRNVNEFKSAAKLAPLGEVGKPVASAVN